MAHPTARYEPRQASHAALYRIVLDHLETFCVEAARARDGLGLPRFVRVLTRSTESGETV